MIIANGIVIAVVTTPHGIVHHEPQVRDQDDENAEHGNHGDGARETAHFFADHLGQRFAVAANRGEQNHEVLHGSAEQSANENP
jgi:hypothetical protein